MNSRPLQGRTKGVGAEGAPLSRANSRLSLPGLLLQRTAAERMRHSSLTEVAGEQILTKE